MPPPETNKKLRMMTDMKKIFLAVVACVCMAGFVARADDMPKADVPAEPAAPAKAEGAPIIKFEKDTFDFGTTSQVQSVTGTFVFTNSGASDLKVEKPKPSCGCTVAGVKPEGGILKPGEKGELTFSLNVGHARGQLSKSITVPSNDPKNPNVSLKIMVNVKQVIEFSPAAINLGDMRQGKTTNVVVEVKRVDGKKLAINRAEGSVKSVHVKVEPVESSEGTTAKLLIEVVADDKPRRFFDSVNMYTDDAPQPAAIIPVTGRVVGEVSITPEGLFWGIPDAKNFPGPNPAVMTTRKVQVEATAPDKPLEIKNAATDIKDLSLEVVTKEQGKKYELVAKLSAPPKESLTGVITFETNAAGQSKVTIPVTINVMKR